MICGQSSHQATAAVLLSKSWCCKSLFRSKPCSATLFKDKPVERGDNDGWSTHRLAGVGCSVGACPLSAGCLENDDKLDKLGCCAANMDNDGCCADKLPNDGCWVGYVFGDGCWTVKLLSRMAVVRTSYLVMVAGLPSYSARTVA